MTPQQEASPVETLAPAIPSLREILGPERADIVAAACRTTGIKFQTMNDRSSAFYLYKIARLFE